MIEGDKGWVGGSGLKSGTGGIVMVSLGFIAAEECHVSLGGIKMQALLAESCQRW